MKEFIKKIPVINKIAQFLYHRFILRIPRFTTSKNYWEERYHSGGTSGAGSYGDAAIYKAEILNNFVKENKINSVIEFGCGDGNQLKLAEYPSYTGFDVSDTAVTLCKQTFNDDKTKSFKKVEQYSGEKADLCLSLDVIYHLIEDEIFNNYMDKLFASASKYVIIYSSNTDNQQDLQANHVKHRKFSDWVEANRSDWVLKEHTPNPLPIYKGDLEKYSVDFHIYESI
ncbi:methyltransferase domain-containing protein [Maridesulfovibrio sp.]|uniref:methyltransferase domain-containing protein n=1 Tax=Maridesulfovibrio sp. TaxID=2795000 RepID=UPI0029CA122B|nr:methyltransferase domain-containing protein [Maridesulfovibrio sp.]